jgi:excinuclease ABC subunit C
VGKAKNLRSRVRSYFQAGGSDERMYLPALMREVEDLSTIIAKTEKEAAILENNLIKEHQPRFNVKLRDDKEYLNLRLDPSVRWPRLQLVRRPKPDGARYFGPYHSATSARRTLHLVEKHFKLRTCSDRELASRKRPCLKYQIKRCPAPCVFEIDTAEYSSQVAAVELFLDGRHDELSKELDARMKQAAARLEYELAASYRDQLRAVDSVRQSQRVVSVDALDQDVVGLYREGDLVELALLTVREGRVVEALSFSQQRVGIGDDEVMAALVRELYGPDSGRRIPDRILLPTLPDGAAGVEEWLTEQRSAIARAANQRVPRKVRLESPHRGARKQLLELAQENAAHAFGEKRRASEDIEARLSKLQQRLRLPTLPRVIECTDISHLGGLDTVGSLVALSDGEPDKSRYRTYKVETPTEGDDYAAMYEVLSRRFRRGRDAKGKAAEEADGAAVEWELPDLFVVDGGRGQLAVALSAAHDLGLFELQLCGLAKERENTAGDKLVDRVYLPGQKNPIALRPNCPELFLLARARDEAHRFANRGRSRLGKARRMRSQLDRIPGIGPKSKESLLKHFGSVDNIRSATAEELLSVAGINSGHVRALRQHWSAQESTDSEK